MKDAKALIKNEQTEEHIAKINKEHTREIWLDYTKVFACFLVVVGHLLQGLEKANIPWNNNLYYYINEFIYIFHMPLFMCLSGYLYGKYAKIRNTKDYFKFIKKKIINLGIPYLVFYILYVILNMLFASNVNSQKGISDILNIFTNPISPFWFLYALIVIFILIPVIEKILKHNEKNVFLVLVILYIAYSFITTKVYAINIFVQYAVYFYFGVLLVKLDKIRQLNIRSTLINVLLFTILAITYCIIKKQSPINTHIIHVLNLILGLYGIIVNINVFNKLKKNKSFYWMYKYTFPIFLMHTIFSAGIRIVLLKIGIYNFYVHFILGIIIGMSMPIIVEKILDKMKYGNIILYPISTIQNIKKSKV